MNTISFSRRSVLTVMALAAMLTAPARAQTARPVVVELFTSQGCSSCPPADALMIDLAKRPDVIALSFNVDYWDYTGWKDSLARPEFGLRARAYVDRMKLQSPYTPQMIVDGLIDVVGNNKGLVAGAVQKQTNAPRDAVPVAIARSGDKIGVSLGEGRAVPGARILVLRTKSAITIEIGKGENKGKQITYTNSVRRVMDAGEWTGKAANLTLPVTMPDLKEPTDGVVVLIQGGPGGPILGAAQLRL
jgi:hypothetical protein